MAGTLLDGPRTWGFDRSTDGHRSYHVTHLVEVDSPLDGPSVVLATAGLPAVGAYWDYDNELDLWAFCSPECRISIHQEKEGDPAIYYRVDNTFTTVSFKRCQDTPIEDPLSEPAKLSGGFTKYSREMAYDLFGNLLQTSSFEPLRGPQVEFDDHRSTVRVEQNVSSLSMFSLNSFMNTVNDDVLWGMPRRCVKLSNITWDRLVYGSCGYYFKRGLEFELDYKTFDRSAPDWGNKCLNGHINPTTGNWVLDNIGGNPPDPNNPTHYTQYKDIHGENSKVMLDGSGLPADSVVGSGTTLNASGPVANIPIIYYPESNFLLLGVPTSF